MTSRYARFSVLLLFGVLPLAALADAETGEGYVSVMARYIDDDPDRGVDDAVGGQAGLGWALHDNWNVEVFLAMASPGGALDSEQVSLGADLQLVFARDSRFTPYVFAGVGYMQILYPAGRDTDDGGMYSAGAGFLADIFGNSRVALRGEYRYRRDSVYSTDLDDQIVSLGLHFPFGGSDPIPVAAPVEADTDGDGVPDSRDRCPGTPAGASVDADGCMLDSDGDGVPDHRDSCPNTVRGAPVDERGCELDSDNDGVVDRQDQCPDTRAGAQVDIVGCEIKEEIRLPGVNFEPNSDQLLPGAAATLDAAAATLLRNPTIKVEVAGHTDSDGTADHNQSLSTRRALTVRDYLVRAGVGESRLSARGYGESQPIADNTTPAGKAQNRRVVLRVTER